jgi:hypothetical protein
MDQNEIHRIILAKLDKIEEKTDHKYSSLEKELVNVKIDIANALKIISGHSTIISYYKTESDGAKDQLIEQQRKKIEENEKLEKERNKKILYTLISVISFILVTIGAVNKDLIKVLTLGV